MIKKFIDAVFPDKLGQMCKTEKGTVLKGILILALGVVLSNIISLAGELLFATVATSPSGEALYLSLFPALLSGLTRAGASFFGLLIVFFVLHFLAMLAGGKGSFGQFLYMASMPWVVLSVIGAILELPATLVQSGFGFPCCTGITAFVIDLYGIYLLYVVFKAVHRIKDNRRMVGLLLVVALILGVLLVIVLMFVWAVLVGAAASHGRFGNT